MFAGRSVSFDAEEERGMIWRVRLVQVWKGTSPSAVTSGHPGAQLSSSGTRTGSSGGSAGFSCSVRCAPASGDDRSFGQRPAK